MVKMPKRRRETVTLVMIFAVAVTVPVAGGAIVQVGQVADDTSVTDRAGIEREYDAVAADFPYTLPDGAAFPADAPYQFAAQPTVYELGIGEAAAYFYWQCAWMNVAVDGAAQSAEAIEQLALWDDTEFYADHVVVEPTDPTWAEGIVEPARRGDLANLISFRAGTCTGPLEKAGVTE